MFNGKLKQSLAGGLSLTEAEPLNYEEYEDAYIQNMIIHKSGEKNG